MWRNNVQDGVWYGQDHLVAAQASYVAPAMDDMKVDYKPVSAKDFV